MEPRRKIRAQHSELIRPIPGRWAGSVGIAIGELAGESAEHSDTEGVDVGSCVPRFTTEHLWRHVGTGSGNLIRGRVFKTPDAHRAEIDELQRAVTLENHVVGFDVAVNDAVAMQRRHGSGQLDRDVTALLQTQRGAAGQSRLQKLALIERHDRVQTALPPTRQLYDSPEPRAVHARSHPRLAQE